MINEEMIAEITKYDLSTLYQNYLAAATENKVDQEIIDDVKYGTEGLSFDIRDSEAFDNNIYAIQIFYKLNQVKIGDKVYDLKAYRDELERRTIIMRNYLLSLAANENPWQPRFDS